MSALSKQELTFYSRHLLLDEIGVEGQTKLKQARILIVGVGGLGTPVATYLAAAGVGNIGIVEFDSIDLSNLHRQVLYTHSDVGLSKAQCAKTRLLELNPHINIDVFETRLDADNIIEIFENYDIIVDGTDNFSTRYLINDACVMLQKRNIHASIFQFDGQLTTFGEQEGPCYRCLYPEPPPEGMVPSCAEGGVLGVLPAVMGSMQATEVVKSILQIGQPTVGRLLHYDALTMSLNEFEIEKNPTCPVCSQDKSNIELDAIKHVQCDLEEQEIEEINCRALFQKIQQREKLALIHVREEKEAVFGDFKGATIVNLDALESLIVSLDPNVPTVVICHLGHVSKQAAKMLMRHGIDMAYSLKGGLRGWQFMIESMEEVKE